MKICCKPKLAVDSVSLQNRCVSRQNDENDARYDEAVYELALGNVDSCIEKLQMILKDTPDSFEAQLALGMAFLRKGDAQRALEEGLKAEALQPEDQMAQMNLSMFYIRLGDKKKAEEHGLRAKLLYWKKAGKQPPPFLQQAVQNDLKVLAQNPPPQPMIFTKKKGE